MKARNMLWMIFIVVVLWIAGMIVPLALFDSLEKGSQFGDMFGMINSLFSGLALGGISVTLYFQQRGEALLRKQLYLAALSAYFAATLTELHADASVVDRSVALSKARDLEAEIARLLKELKEAS